MNNQYYPSYKANPYYGGAGPMQPAVYPQYQSTPAPQAGKTMPIGTMPATGIYPPPAGIPIAPAAPSGYQVPGMLPTEQSYIENILRLNKGKLVQVFATFENNSEWNAKKWEGFIEAAGRDHLILSQPETGLRLLLPMVYLDYILFEEEIDYDPTFSGTPLTTYAPR